MENNELIRYSEITWKNPREIVLLRGSGCKWKKCSFCDYHMDYSPDEAANFALNREVLSHVTGRYKSLEAINSGSFCDLDEKTMEEILRVCKEKDIRELRFESHWIHRKKIADVRNFFGAHGITVRIKMGVETFDEEFREKVMVKGMKGASPKQIAEYADEVCLLFGLTGQTLESMKHDIETGLHYFQRICINIMNENTTEIHPDPEVIRLFMENLFLQYRNHPRADILIENTEFGVGGTEDEK